MMCQCLFFMIFRLKLVGRVACAWRGHAHAYIRASATHRRTVSSEQMAMGKSRITLQYAQWWIKFNCHSQTYWNQWDGCQSEWGDKINCDSHSKTWPSHEKEYAKRSDSVTSIVRNTPKERQNHDHTAAWQRWTHKNRDFCEQNQVSLWYWITAGFVWPQSFPMFVRRIRNSHTVGLCVCGYVMECVFRCVNRLYIVVPQPGRRQHIQRNATAVY